MDSLVGALAAAPVADRALVVGSALVCIAAIVLVAARPSWFSLVSRAYGARLLRPWRLATFVLPGAIFTFGAPYMGDPTWDRVDGALMSVLTYLLAPWSTGTLFRVLRRRARMRELLVAIAGWLLAASVCYVTYLIFRDGRVPPTTWSNLVASSAAFFSAGLFWSITHDRARGVVFAFMLEDWPSGEEERQVTSRMGLVGVLVAVVVGLVLLPFFLQLR